MWLCNRQGRAYKLPVDRPYKGSNPTQSSYGPIRVRINFINPVSEHIQGPGAGYFFALNVRVIQQVWWMSKYRPVKPQYARKV